MPSAATSVTFSPRGDYIATTHVGQLGVFLWANRMLYTTVSLAPITASASPSPSATSASTVALPTVAVDDDASNSTDSMTSSTFLVEPAVKQQQQQQDGDEDASSSSKKAEEPLAKGEGLATLSGLPKTRWHNLLSLDAIKERSKPVEAPKAPSKGTIDMIIVFDIHIHIFVSFKSAVLFADGRCDRQVCCAE